MNEDELKWVANAKKILLLFNCSMKIFVLEPIGFKEIEYFSRVAK